MSRQEQEKISSTFANIGVPAPAPAQLALVSTLSGANHTIQPSTTHRAQESTSQKRSYEENSEYDADISGDERPSKVRRRRKRQNSVHTPAASIETRNSEASSPPASNEASIVEQQGPEAALSPVPSMFPITEARYNQNVVPSEDTAYIHLTLETSSDEEEDDVSSPAQTKSRPNITFVDLTFEDSNDEEESVAAMTQAYIGDGTVLIEEERLETFLPEPTTEFQSLLDHAQAQKLHCLDKWGGIGLEDDVEFKRGLAVLGTSGNVYLVSIEKKPGCNCPDGIKNISYVHLIFILTQFLNLPAPLRHQSAFLEVELRCMMGDESDWMAPLSTDKFCKQKSVEEQESCYICFENLEGDAFITWCRGQCGMNYHLRCIWTWAETNFEKGRPDVTCGNFRGPWIWIGRQLSTFVEGAWNWQFGIRHNDAGYRSLSDPLRRDLSREGYLM